MVSGFHTCCKLRLELALLLNIASLALKAGIEWLAVDQHISRDNAHGGPFCQYVKECCFASTGDTHQSSKSPRLHPSGNVVQQPAGLALDFDVVNHIPPREDVGLRLEVM